MTRFDAIRDLPAPGDHRVLVKCAKPVKRSTVKRKKQLSHRVMVAVLRHAVFDRDGYLCRACYVLDGVDKTAEDMHEIVFRSQGGQQTLENCVSLCHRHHMQIHARRLWIMGRNANESLRFVTEKSK